MAASISEKRRGLQDQPRRLFGGLGPLACGGDRIGIAVERVDGGPGIEQAAGIAPGAECRVDDHAARLRIERGDRLVEQDRDVPKGVWHAHAFLPLPPELPASARQAACGPS